MVRVIEKDYAVAQQVPALLGVRRYDGGDEPARHGGGGARRRVRTQGRMNGRMLGRMNGRMNGWGRLRRCDY